MKERTKEILLWTGVAMGSLGTAAMADKIIEQATHVNGAHEIQNDTSQLSEQSFEQYQNSLAKNILLASVALAGTVYTATVAYELTDNRRRSL